MLAIKRIPPLQRELSFTPPRYSTAEKGSNLLTAMTFLDLPRIAHTSLALIYFLLTFVSKFAIDSYIQRSADEVGGLVDQVKRCRYHVLGLLSRVLLLYIAILLCELLSNAYALDTALFVALFTFDFAVVAYSSLA